MAIHRTGHAAARTRELIAMLRQVSGWKRTRPRRIARPFPPPAQPDAIRLAYFQAMRPTLERARAEVEQVKGRILQLLAEHRAYLGRKDEAPEDHPTSGKYRDVLQRYEAAAVDGVQLGVITETDVGPAVCLDLPGSPYVVIMAGQHGEEDAGPEFLAQQASALFRLARSVHIGLRLYPCVNPEGYDHDKRRDDRGCTHANAFVEYEVLPGAWAGELKPGEHYLATRRPLHQAPETRALQDDLEQAIHRLGLPAALLDLHQDSILKPGYAFAYIGRGRRERYADIMRRASLPLANTRLENASWSQIKAGTDADGLVSDFRDGSVTDWADEMGIPLTACVEACVDRPYDEAFACYAEWCEAFLWGSSARGQHLDSFADDARRLIDQAARAWGHAFRPQALREIAETFGRRTDKFNREQLDQRLRETIGVNLSLFEPGTLDKIPAFAEENVKLIKTVPERYFDRLRGDIEQAFSDGSHPSTLARELEDRYEMSERDARRIARDQIGKLNAEVNRDRLEAIGIERYVWRTMNDNRVRDEHRDLEGKVFSWEEPPEEGNPGEAIQCFPESTAVRLFNADVDRLTRRWYDGELTTIITESGVTLQGTPNHPVLTRGGWKPLHLLEVGDEVWEANRKAGDLAVGDPERQDPMVGEVFRAFALACSPDRVTSPLMGFHGDMTNEQVDVVSAQWGLWDEVEPLLLQAVGKELLAIADDPSLGQRATLHGFFSLGDAANRIMGAAGLLLPVLRGHGGFADEHCLRAIARLQSVADKIRSNGSAADTESIGQGLHAPAGQEHLARVLSAVVLGIGRWAIDAIPGGDAPGAEQLREAVSLPVVHPEQSGRFGDGVPAIKKSCRIVEKTRREFHGHVYNLQTSSGWYVAQSLIVHNCRCYAEPVMSDVLGEEAAGEA